jgi:hypothetical protein
MAAVAQTYGAGACLEPAHHLTSTLYATSGLQHLNNGSQFASHPRIGRAADIC